MKKLILLSILVLVTVSCNTRAHKFSSSKVYEGTNTQSTFGIESDVDDLKSNNSKKVYKADAKIVYKELDEFNDKLNELLNQYDAYIVNQSSYLVSLRVKYTELDSLLGDLDLLGSVEYINKSSYDIGIAYANDSIRLSNAKASLNRYLELLEKAENVQEIVLIEKELERLNTSIETLTFALNRKDRDIAYSEVKIRLKQKVKPGLLGYIGIGIYKSVKWLFVRG